MTFAHKKTGAGSAARERGTVLLMALIIMSGAVISSIGIGVLIQNSIQQSRVLDNSMVAYYAAESGIEEAIYAARRSDTTPASVSAATVLDNGATWSRTVATSESVVYAGNLIEDGIYEVALYNPDASINALDIDSVKLTWADSCAGCTVAETSFITWNAGSPVIWNPNVTVLRNTWTSDGVTLSVPDVTKLQRLRITSKGGDISNLQIRAYNASGVQTTVPGRLKIDAIGRFANASQKLTATLPRTVPLSGIFDYVVFTECSLVKGGPSSSCP